MKPLIINCSGLRLETKMSGVLSAGVEKLRNDLRTRVSRGNAVSPVQEITSALDRWSDTVDSSKYSDVQSRELDGIKCRLRADRVIEVSDSTNTWEFVKRVAAIAQSAGVYVVKPLTANPYTDSVWLCICKSYVHDDHHLMPNDYIDFLYLMYSRAVYMYDLCSNGPPDLRKNMLQLYWVYMCELCE